MSITTSEEFFADVAKLPLLTSGQLSVLKSLRESLPDAKTVARECITRNWLTVYQANQLLQGKGRDLSLGSYFLQERLGEGGMGQVFKAMHRNLGRVSALKVIHKERLDSPNAVKRFQREVRAAAALHHVNIVLAYDADEIDGRHLLVMEYIESARDLAQLVKQNGPLPVAQACDYVRQAALGLQHAYEQGMVHRDIKPANLLVTGSGKVVKVLDMGLALTLQGSVAADDGSSIMTKTGVIMGTPDYLAPEQAMDSHTVDIRADLYSLGCTLYFLIAGKVPFPGGSIMEKLLKHKLEEPKPLGQLCPGLSPAVAAVVRKLMAKNPDQRYQTPVEAAQALAAAMMAVHHDQPASATAATIAIASVAVATTPSNAGSFTAAIGYMSKRSDTVALEPVAPGAMLSRPNRDSGDHPRLLGRESMMPFSILSRRPQRGCKSRLRRATCFRGPACFKSNTSHKRPRKHGTQH